MAWKIEIIKTKPNPMGKDKSYGYPIDSKLLGEWVDLKNVGDANCPISELHLAHTEFEPKCIPKTKPAIYFSGKDGTLLVGKILRVHTGKSQSSSKMEAQDATGCDLHAYAESSNFVLNNDCGDTISVWYQSNKDKSWHKDDSASYKPKPVEGKILVRKGDLLE